MQQSGLRVGRVLGGLHARRRPSARATACRPARTAGQWGSPAACSNSACVIGGLHGRLRARRHAVLRQRRPDLQRERPVGERVGVHVRVRERKLHRRLRARIDAVLGQRSADVLVERHVGHRVRLHELCVRGRSVHGRVCSGRDAVLGQRRPDVQLQRSVGERRGVRERGVRHRSVHGRVHPRGDAVLGQRRADVRQQRSMGRRRGLHQLGVRVGWVHRRLRARRRRSARATACRRARRAEPGARAPRARTPRASPARAPASACPARPSARATASRRAARAGNGGPPSRAWARRACRARAPARARRATRSARATPPRCAAARARWGAPVACSNQACINGVCSGSCAPTSTQCSPTDPATADVRLDRDLGQHRRGLLEPDVRLGIRARACALPDRCNAPASSRRRAARTGTWQSAGSCTSQACVNGACTGVCTPGATQCSGNGVQTCQNNGTWGTAIGVLGLGVRERRVHRRVRPGHDAVLRQRRADVPAERDLERPPRPAPTRPAYGGACTGSCAPGQTTCSGNGLETCTRAAPTGRPSRASNRRA